MKADASNLGNPLKGLASSVNFIDVGAVLQAGLNDPLDGAAALQILEHLSDAINITVLGSAIQDMSANVDLQKLGLAFENVLSNFDLASMGIIVASLPKVFDFGQVGTMLGQLVTAVNLPNVGTILHWATILTTRSAILGMSWQPSMHAPALTKQSMAQSKFNKINSSQDMSRFLVMSRKDSVHVR